ncbi:MAG: type II 3-dehydroquinate dehydratase [Oligoflexales bacterium]
MRILIANGVNLDLLGQRDPQFYGSFSLADLEADLRGYGEKLKGLLEIPKLEMVFFQTNCEREFLEKVSEKWDGALINPGAWTHNSYALADRISDLNLKFVEVHISNLAKRESFRQKSVLGPYATGVVYGMGRDSYRAALTGLLSRLSRKTYGPS